MPAVGDEMLIGGQSELLQRGSIRLEARACVACHVLRAAGDERDAPMAVPDEMPHRVADARGVVSDNGRARFPGGDEHDRVPGSDQGLQLTRARFCVQRIDGDETICVPRANGDKVALGGWERPGGAERIGRRGRRPHAAAQQQVTAQIARGLADPAVDRVQIAERRCCPVVLPAGQDPDGGARTPKTA